MPQRLVGTAGPLTQWEESPEDRARMFLAQIQQADRQQQAALAAQQRAAQQEQLAAIFRQQTEAAERQRGRDFEAQQGDLQRSAAERANLLQVGLQRENMDRADLRSAMDRAQAESETRMGIAKDLYVSGMFGRAGRGGGRAAGPGGVGGGQDTPVVDTRWEAEAQANAQAQADAFLNDPKVLAGNTADPELQLMLRQLAEQNPYAAQIVDRVIESPEFATRVERSNKPGTLGGLARSALGGAWRASGVDPERVERFQDPRIRAREGLSGLRGVVSPVAPPPSAVSNDLDMQAALDFVLQAGGRGQAPPVTLVGETPTAEPRRGEAEDLLDAVLRERSFLRDQLPDAGEAEIARRLREDVSQAKFRKGQHPGGRNDPFGPPIQVRGSPIDEAQAAYEQAALRAPPGPPPRSSLPPPPQATPEEGRAWLERQGKLTRRGLPPLSREESRVRGADREYQWAAQDLWDQLMEELQRREQRRKLEEELQRREQWIYSAQRR